MRIDRAEIGIQQVTDTTVQSRRHQRQDQTDDQQQRHQRHEQQHATFQALAQRLCANRYQRNHEQGMPQRHALAVERKGIEQCPRLDQRDTGETASERSNRVSHGPARDHAEGCDNEERGEHRAEPRQFPVNRGAILM